MPKSLLSTFFSRVSYFLFIFVCTIPLFLLRLGIFVFTFPNRWQKIKYYRAAPKKIRIRRLSNDRLSFPEVNNLIHALQEKEAPHDSTKNLSRFSAWEGLWEEEMSEDWKFPTILELTSVRDEVLADIAKGTLSGNGRVLVWAFDDDSRRFVAFDPRLGKNETEYNWRSLLHANSSDSGAKYFAYAVSVTLANGKLPH